MQDSFNSDKFGINYKSKRKESNTNIQNNHRREYRKINQFKSVDEISNDNMYKNNSYYTINNRVEFEEKAEKSFHLFFQFCYSKEGIKLLLSVLYLRLLSSRINSFKDFFKLSNIIYLENTFHILSFIVSIYFTAEKYLKNQLINLLIFIVFSFNHCLYILLIISKYHFIAISSELIFNYSLAFLLDIPHKLVLLSFCLVCFIIFIFEKGLIGLSVFYPILGITFALFYYYLYNITIREIWALFDSFKRSFFSIKKCVLDSDPNPNFIISLKMQAIE